MMNTRRRVGRRRRAQWACLIVGGSNVCIATLPAAVDDDSTGVSGGWNSDPVINGSAVATMVWPTAARNIGSMIEGEARSGGSGGHSDVKPNS
jgi:hypothetical protein